MLIFVIVFFLIFLVGINKICCKDNISRLCVNIHTIWWSLLVVISLLNMFSMKDVSLFTYFLICSYYISFNIGFLMANYVFGSKYMRFVILLRIWIIIYVVEFLILHCCYLLYFQYI